jgi:hypothetical protein
MAIIGRIVVSVASFVDSRCLIWSIHSLAMSSLAVAEALLPPSDW